MFKIGEFSRLVRVSPRMLRHYEKCGLLVPAYTDEYTGYRYYQAVQVTLVTNIIMLRDLGFSIEETKEILPYLGDFTYMEKIFEEKARSIRIAISSEEKKLDRLLNIRNNMRKRHNYMVFEVELKKIPAVKVLSLRGVIPQYNQEGILWEKLGRYIGEKQISCHKDGYSTYCDEEYTEENPDVEIAIPVDVLGTSDGAFIYKEYAEIPEAATVRFTGTFEGGHSAAIEKLAHWMEQNGYDFAGPIRGHVLVSPSEDVNPDKWVTEIEVPVVKK